MKKHKTLGQKIAFSSHLFKVETEEVELASGKIVSRDRILHPGAIIVIPQTSDGKLLLVNQYRHSIREELLEFPAGTLEVGEVIKQCAERELAEEVGKKASQWQELGHLYPGPGILNEIQYLFFAKGLSDVEQNLDDEEIIEVRPMTPLQVEEAIRSGKINDGKTIASYFKAKVMGLI